MRTNTDRTLFTSHPTTQCRAGVLYTLTEQWLAAGLSPTTWRDWEKMKETDATKYRRTVGRWRCATFLLLALCLILVIAFIVVVVVKDKMFKAMMVPTCSGNTNSINLDTPDKPGVFHDLTPKEMRGIQGYLYSQTTLNLVDPSEAAVNKSYIFMADLYLPSKKDVLEHLDGNADQPIRQAKVVIFRGDKATPDIEEYIVGPLPDPTSHAPLNRNRQTPIPFNYRPITGPEMTEVLEKLTREADEFLASFLRDKYGGTFTNCGDRCLAFRFLTSMSRAITGQDSRKLWFWGHHFVEFYVLNPIDFNVLVRLDNKTIEVERVWHGGRTYASFHQLNDAYEKKSLSTPRIPFPHVDRNYFSTMNLRGTRFPETPTRNPVQIEPDGKRYSINGRHVSYMGWELDFRMSISSGPQLFDIRYRNERIAYELSLQEIAVFYSGGSPAQRFANYIDSVGLIGASARGLIPGADCPEGATFVNVDFMMESSRDPSTAYNAFCIFEFNTGIPLRRHHAYTAFSGHYYEGVADVVLTVRTIVTIANYDYLFDFTFHQNGAIEVRGISTGYILSEVFTNSERKYGVPLHNNITGAVHHHMFQFKADLDIKGVRNSFKTMDIVPEDVAIGEFSVNNNARYHQTMFQNSQKSRELDATYRFNFASPKYLVIHNTESISKYGNSRGYRLLINGMSKQVIAEGEGNEPAVSWARYQMAVTKMKESERESSSIYAIWDADDPVVRFQNFISDDESIVQQDLVAWISLGTHHIPHTEDLPVTPTVGMSLSFFLLPYNYFDEDPGMSSGNAIRIEWDDSSKKGGIKIERYGVPDSARCTSPPSRYDETVKEKPAIALQDLDSVVGVF
ncbi:hypothetical protein ScPMuIL_017568 [Solemya velum]